MSLEETFQMVHSIREHQRNSVSHAVHSAAHMDGMADIGMELYFQLLHEGKPSEAAQAFRESKHLKKRSKEIMDEVAKKNEEMENQFHSRFPFTP